MHPSTQQTCDTQHCSEWPQGFDIRAEHAEQQEMIRENISRDNAFNSYNGETTNQ